jgi:hypothetical protein
MRSQKRPWPPRVRVDLLQTSPLLQMRVHSPLYDGNLFVRLEFIVVSMHSLKISRTNLRALTKYWRTSQGAGHKTVTSTPIPSPLSIADSSSITSETILPRLARFDDDSERLVRVLG